MMNDNDDMTILDVCKINAPFGFIKRNVIYLVDKGSNLNIQDEYGETALICVCRIDDIETAKILVDKGANLDLQDKDGWTALMFACL